MTNQMRGLFQSSIMCPAAHNSHESELPLNSAAAGAQGSARYNLRSHESEKCLQLRPPPVSTEGDAG